MPSSGTAPLTPPPATASGRYGCARCGQRLGDPIPATCPECGARLDPSDTGSVRDIEWWRRRRTLIATTCAGVAVAAVFAFFWWFAMMKHNRWMPLLNQLVPLGFFALGPLVVMVRAKHPAPAIGYALGSWSFVLWCLVAIAVDQLLQGASLSSLNIEYASAFRIALPAVAIMSTLGLLVGAAIRFARRRVAQRRVT